MKFQKIGVVGAGMMGSEIALCFAQYGYHTILSDTDKARADKGKENVAGILEKRVTKGKLEAAKKDEYLGNIATTDSLEDMADCDMVVEAVVEVLDIKHAVYRKLDAVLKPDAIIASNTSSISITKLAAAVSDQRVGRFIGAHFNSPASVMKLVEVIPAIRTTEDITGEVVRLLADIGKEPVKVKDVTGFVLNRMFHAFYLEACRLAEEGVASIEDIDKVCLYGLGHPVGIFKLLDLLGHDLCMNVDQILFDAYGERFRPSPYIQRLVDAGMLGKKSGRGFYEY
ncbi:MAG: 3-hydroxyacyl-CoA dehydrogenase family protein [Defluviitaleaceae bacterium]|nr:3-hydroxyacyl-CoA dehydrogenase family protein [Defluviitaleaceae bacterium]